MRERDRFDSELRALLTARDRETSSNHRAERSRIAGLVRQNAVLGRKLGWQSRYRDILHLLGFGRGRSEQPRDFVTAVTRWQNHAGLAADGLLGQRTWERMRAALDERAPQPRREFQVAESKPRLIKGALGEAFADFTAMVPVPDAVIEALPKSKTFRDVAKVIDKHYVSLAAFQKDLDARMGQDGRVEKGKLKGKRVLSFMERQIGFEAAGSIEREPVLDVINLQLPDHLRNADPSDKLLMDEALRLWVLAICHEVVYAFHQVTKKRLPVTSDIVDRIHEAIDEEGEARRITDKIVRELRATGKVRALKHIFFGGFSEGKTVEKMFYPLNFWIVPSQYMTCLEYFTTRELMADAYRAENLKNSPQKGEFDKMADGAHIKTPDAFSQFPYPVYISDDPDDIAHILIGKDYPIARYMRRVMDASWRTLNGVENKNPITDTDLSGKRFEHEDLIFGHVIKYRLG